MKRLLLLAVSACALTFSQVAFADAKADREYVDNIKKEMLAACKADSDTSDDACQCVVDQITTKLSAKELRLMDEGTATPQEKEVISGKVMDTVMACAPK